MDKGSKRDFQVSVWSYDHLTYILLLFKHSAWFPKCSENFEYTLQK